MYIIIFESLEARRNPRGIPWNPRIYDIISTAMIAIIYDGCEIFLAKYNVVRNDDGS